MIVRTESSATRSCFLMLENRLSAPTTVARMVIDFSYFYIASSSRHRRSRVYHPGLPLIGPMWQWASMLGKTALEARREASTSELRSAKNVLLGPLRAL